ncbi:MAG: arylamine N-acetyltransferase [Proteobacteria bacterium]|nr:arylamine N-acetyltransferase [Pseudomonadota bacterium]
MHYSTITTGYLDAIEVVAGAPDLRLLTELVRRHVARFAFSSVGPRLGDALPLDVPALYDRIVARARGGYCFEQNALFYAVLEELGFDVRMSLARVIYNQDIDSPLTHRISLVRFGDDQYVADVGFGPMGPAVPVSMRPRAPLNSECTFGVCERHSGEFHLQTFKDGGDFSLYKFSPGHFGLADCELGHFYSHRHPKAVFVNNLVASRILDDEIRSLRNRDYWVIAPAGPIKTAIESAGQLHELLNREFDIQVTATESNTLFDAIP